MASKAKVRAGACENECALAPGNIFEVHMDKDSLIALAKQKAAEHGLDPALVCAVCEQESGWNPWATRYEPEFMRRYVGPLYTKGGMTATEAYTRSMSWGLMQIMGQVAREEGYDSLYIAELSEPAIGLDCGCKHLLRVLQRHPGDDAAALQAWNGGGNANYASEVMARFPTYVESQSPELAQAATAASQSPKIIPIDPQT